MLNEVTRLTKGDFSKFKEKKYQVERVRFSGLRVVKKELLLLLIQEIKLLNS